LGWVWSGGSNLAPAPGPLGSVAGDPDRHRGWLLCPSSVPVAAGRGLRPRVFSAHRPAPQLQVQDSVMGCPLSPFTHAVAARQPAAAAGVGVGVQRQRAPGALKPQLQPPQARVRVRRPAEAERPWREGAVLYSVLRPLPTPHPAGAPHAPLPLPAARARGAWHSGGWAVVRAGGLALSC
jgi:hypothetical protein